MTSPSPVLAVEPERRPLRPAVRKLPVARGTNTSLIKERRIRLHAQGEQPWLKDDNGERDKVHVEKHGEGYVVYRPSVGALSALKERDYVAFNVFLATRGDIDAMAHAFRQMGASEQYAKRRAEVLGKQLETEGWLRAERPTDEEPRLAAVYFTVTRWCDRGCPYCYQGLNDRQDTDMTMDQVKLALERIQAVNPRAHLVVTGGEPLSHSRIYDIFDLIEEMGFTTMIITNGTYLDKKMARFLKTLKGLKFVQISLDGFTAETHEVTRGKGHFPKVMAAIRNVADEGLPFKLAPTLHEGNYHELPQIAEMAYELGGATSPNPLKELPHAGLDYTQVTMSNATLHEALRASNQHMIDKFGFAETLERTQKYAALEPNVCSVIKPNSSFICGMAHSLIDIDWNGDVYPCHLNKGPELKIGNVFEEDFDAIFQRVEDRQIRVKSYEIEQCSGCKFGSTCGGGCRAGAYFTYATMEHPDEHCEVSYASRLGNLMVKAGIKKVNGVNI
jgi:radical SAM protein with 4Fe4S-binding SPASM domain